MSGSKGAGASKCELKVIRPQLRTLAEDLHNLGEHFQLWERIETELVPERYRPAFRPSRLDPKKWGSAECAESIEYGMAWANFPVSDRVKGHLLALKAGRLDVLGPLADALEDAEWPEPDLLTLLRKPR